MKPKFILLLAVLFSLMSCENEVETYLNVQLNPSFIQINDSKDEPMRIKSNLTNDSVISYAVQIYEDGSPYYYGLFNDVSKMQILLKTHKTYKFNVIAYKMGTGNGLKTEIDTSGVYLFLPEKIKIENKFFSGDKLKNISMSNHFVMKGLQKDYNEVDVFYVSKEIEIEKGTSNIEFKLLRMGFGLNINVDGLSNGLLKVLIGNDTIQLNPQNPVSSSVRIFSTLSFDSIYNNADVFSDSIQIKVQWSSDYGTTFDAKSKFLFHRNLQKTINVQLNSITNNLNFEGWNYPKEGLVAWYPFNGNCTDQSGNNNNGLPGYVVLTKDRFGDNNKAYEFNGYSSYISVPSSTSLELTGDKSISVWAKPLSTSQLKYACLVWKGQSVSYPTFLLTYNFNNIAFLFGKESTNYMLKTDKTLDELANKWVHYLATYSKNTGEIKMYLNGKLYQSLYVGSINSNFSSDYPLTIGWEAISYNSYFYGVIDDVALWNRALTDDEISTVYNYKY